MMNIRGVLVAYLILAAVVVVMSALLPLGRNSTAFAQTTNAIINQTSNGFAPNVITTFYETGLPVGLAWIITYDNISQQANAPSFITFSNINGSYNFSTYKIVNGRVTYIPDIFHGALAAGFNKTINFTANFSTTTTTTIPINTMNFQAIFNEEGLPIGAQWKVTYDNITSTAFAPNSIIFTTSTNGTYTFTIYSVTFNGTVYKPKVSSSTLASGTEENVVFSPKKNKTTTTTTIPINTTTTTTTIPVNTTTTTTVPTNTTTTTTIPVVNNQTTFTENGLPYGILWSVSYNNETAFNYAPGNIVYPIANGIYYYYINPILVNGELYTPTVTNALLAGGGTVKVNFIVSSHITTTTTIPTNIVNTTTTTIPVNITNTTNTTIAQTNVTINSTGPSISAGNFLANNKRVNIRFSRDHVLDGVFATFTETGKRINITVENQSYPTFAPKYTGSPVYQYIQINGTIYGSNTNADKYISGVTYGFSVPASWISSENTTPANIRLFKYTSGGWETLPTRITSTNSTAYFFNATSDSFSTYVVGLVSGGVTTTTPNALLTLPTGSNTYFFVAGGKMSGTDTAKLVVNWTQVANAVQHAGTTGLGTNASSIGNVLSSSRTGNFVFNTGTFTNNQISIEGIGANVVVVNGNVVGNAVLNTNEVTAGNTILSLTYTAQANGAVFLLFASGGNAITAPTLPSSCVNDGSESTANTFAEVANCLFSSTTTNTLSFSVINTIEHVSISAAAYTFGPYLVTYNSVPSSGNIVEGGTTQSNGGTDTLVGTETLNAIQPPANTVFAGWTFNSPTNGITSNFIISGTIGPTNALSWNGYLSVMGNGIVRATWNSIFDTITASNSPIDGNQVQIISTTVANGALATPLTYNYLIYNSVTLVTNELYSGVTLATNSFTYAQNTAWGVGPFTVNVIVTNALTYNAVLVNNVLTYSANGVGSLVYTAYNTLIDANQVQSLTANIAGDTAPFTYNFVVYNGISTPVANFLTTTSSANVAFTFTQNSAWSTGPAPFTYNIVVKDSAHTNNVLTSNGNIYSANNVGVLTYTASTNPVTVGVGTQVLTATVTGDTNSFTYNFLVYNSLGLVDNALYSGVKAQSNTFTYTQNGAWGTGPFTYNLIVIDSATTSNVLTSNGQTYTANVQIVSYTASNVLIDGNQIQTLSVVTANGMQPYTYNYIVYNSIGVVTNAFYSSVTLPQNTFTYTQNSAWGTGPFTYNLIVKDSGPSVTSNNGQTYGANGVGSLTYTASNPIDGNQVQVLTATVTGDTGTFAFNYIVYNSIGVVTNALYSAVASGGATTTNTFTYTQNTAWGTGPFTYNLVVVDSASTHNVLTSNSNIYGANTVGSLIYVAYNTFIDANQVQSIVANVAGDTAPFTYNFLVYNSVGLVANYLDSSTSSANVVFTFTQNSAWSNGPNAFTYNIIVLDSAHTNNVLTSNGNIYSANNVGILTYAASTNPIAAGIGTQVLTATVTGDTNSFTYNFLVYNSVGLVTNALYSAVTAQSNTFTYVQNSAWGTGPFTYNLVVTDSATTKNVLTSNGNIYTASFQITSYTASNVLIDGNQIQTLSVVTANGMQPYTYNYIVYNSIGVVTNALYSGVTLSQNTFTYTQNSAWGTGPFTYNLVITDGGPSTTSDNGQTYGANGVGSLTYTASNIPIDGNQVQVLTATVTGDTGTFAFNYIVYNSIGVVTNSLYSSVASGGATTTNTFTYTQNTAWGTGPFTYNLVVVDSASTHNVLTSNSNIYGANSPGSLVYTAHNTLIDANQVQSIIANVIGDTAPFTYNFLVYNSVGLVANYLDSSTSSANVVFTFTQNSAWSNGPNTFTYNIIVLDSAHTNNVLTSNGNIYSANNVGILTYAASTNPIAAGIGTQVLTATVTGDTNSFTYNFIVYNSLGVVTNALYSGVQAQSNTFTYAQNSAWGTGPFTYNLIVTDSATTKNVLTSNGQQYTATFQIVSYTASNVLIDGNQIQTLSVVTANGMKSYTYNYIVYNSIGVVTNALYSGVTLSQNTFTYTQNTAWGTGPFTYNLVITDGGPSTTSDNGQTYGANGIGSLTYTASNIPIDANQVQTLSATVTGDTGTFAFNYIVYNSIGVVTNSLYSSVASGGATTTNTFTYTQNTAWGTGPFTYNIVVVDSASTHNVLTSNNNVYGANSPGSLVYIAHNTLIDANQVQTIIANVMGDTAPFTYNFLVYNSVGLVANYLDSSTSSANVVFTFTQNSAWSTGSAPFTYNIVVKDSAHTNNVLTSNGNIYSANNVGILTYTVLNNPIYTGNTQVLTATVTGDTNSFTYNFIVYNSLGVVTNALYSGVQAQSNTFTYTQNSAWGTGTFTYNLIVTDSATTKNVLTYNSQMYTATPSTCTITYSSSQALTSNLITMCNVMVNSGVTLTTGGFSIVSGGTVTINGALNTSDILSNNPDNGDTGTGAGNALSSYGCSGGGGGYDENGDAQYADNGGNTLAPGGLGAPLSSDSADGDPGSEPSSPTLSNANIIMWYAEGIQNYIEGAGGGSSFSDAPANNNGGNGTYGLYLQAQTLSFGAGSYLNSTAQAGGNYIYNPGVDYSGGAGGGGAGLIILATSSGSYSGSPTINTNGGAGGKCFIYHAGCIGSSGNGGAGGSCPQLTYAYSSSPPLSPAGAPTLYIPTNTPQYGQAETIKAVAVAPTDDVEIVISNGIFGSSNVVAGPTPGEVSYTFAATSPVALGTYTVNAFDTTNSIATVMGLNVIQATPLITFPNFPTAHQYTGTPDTLTANIQTYDNQVTANDYLNNVLITAFTTQNTVQEVSPGTYTMTANSFATANYLAGTNTISYILSKATPTITVGNGQDVYINQAPITYSISTAYNQINASLVVDGSVVQSTTNGVSNTYTISSLGIYTVSANTPGNGNYLAVSTANELYDVVANAPATTVPTNILHYVQVPIFNSQAANTAVPFQELLRVSSINYSSYETSNLVNVEFFYSNGIIVPSWLETNNTNSSSDSPYWLKISNGIAGMNAINVYMGFSAQNVMLMNGNVVGEAPNLTIPYYATYINGGPANPYGEYDDGSNVFTVYANFAGTSLPSGWTDTGVGGYTVDNGITLAGCALGSADGIRSPSTYGVNSIVDFYGIITGLIPDCYSGVGLGNNLGSNMILIGTNSSDYSTVSFFAGSNPITSTPITYQTGAAFNDQQPFAVFSEGYTSSKSSADLLYGTVGANYPESTYYNISAVPSAAEPIVIAGGEGLIEWLRLRAYPPNGIMPESAFGCVYTASTNTCNSPTLGFSSQPTFATQNGTITALAPSGSSSNTIEILVNSNIVAQGVGGTSYVTKTLPAGSQTIEAEDVNTLATVNTVLIVNKYYDNANITLPGYYAFSYNVSNGEGAQLPVVSWNSLDPGIFYVNNAGEFVEYQFSTNTVRDIAAITSLDTRLAEYPNLFFMQGPNQDTALFAGQPAYSTNLYLETVNVTTGNVLLVNTKNSIIGDVHFITNEMVLTDNNINYIIFNMSTGASWNAGSLIPYTEANNWYWIYQVNSIINVPALGDTSYDVQQLQITSYNPTIHPTFTSVAEFSAGAGVAVEGVNGAFYDAATEAISYEVEATTPVIPFNSAGVITPTNMILYNPLPAGTPYWQRIAPSTPGAERAVITYTGFGGHGTTLTLAPKTGSAFYTVRDINPFNAYATDQVLPQDPSNYWLFSNDWGPVYGVDAFNYNNTNYGIAYNDSLSSIKTSNVVTWYWNASMSEFPDVVTYTESGLPAGTTWNVVTYSSNVYSAIAPNNILVYYPTVSTYSFSVPSQTNSLTYNPSPSSGNVNTGNILSIVFSVQSSPTCGISLSNTLISFGKVNPGSGAPTGNLIVDTNYQGTAAANIYIAGSNWIYNSNAFYAANTLWNPTSAGSGTGNSVFYQLLSTGANFLNTKIALPSSASNNIYSGVVVPPAENLGTYSANIYIENFC